MFNSPKTLEEAMSYRYRQWAGSPNGSKYNPKQCAYEVHDAEYRSCLHHQCERKPGHGVAGLYCKQHAKLVKE